jgi:hypothetical protein
MRHEKFQLSVFQGSWLKKRDRLWLKLAVLAGAIVLQPLPALAQAAMLNHWRFDPTANQLEVTLKDGVTPRYFLLAQPARIVLELPETEVGSADMQQTYTGASVRQVRVAQFKPGVARVVLELAPNAVLAPGQVQLQRVDDGKAGVGDRWVLRPLLVNAATNQPAAIVPPPTQLSVPPVQTANTGSDPASEAPALIPPSQPVVSAPAAIVEVVPPIIAPTPKISPPAPVPSPAASPANLSPSVPPVAAVPTVPTADFSTPLPPDRPLSSIDGVDRPKVPTPVTVPTAPAPLVVTKPTVSVSPPIAAPQPLPNPSPQTTVNIPVPQPAISAPSVPPVVPQSVSLEAPVATVPAIPPSVDARVPDLVTVPSVTTLPTPISDRPALPEGSTPLPPATVPTPSTPMITVPPLSQPAPSFPTAQPAAPRPTVTVPPLQGNPAVDRPSPPTATPTRPAAIQFGQPLPNRSSQVLTARSSTVLLPVGSVLNLRYPGETSLPLQPDRNQQEVMALQTEIRDYWGRLVVPAGTAVIGRFETGANGSRFVAQAIALGTQNLPLAAQSEVLSGSLRQVSQSRLLLYSGIGGLAGGILGGFSGLDVVGGAAAGAAVGYLTTPKPATIQPGQVVQVKLTEDLK